ncbi:MAG: hypothetical protein IJE59_04580 [Clostridia bacterium]|nr:hypothetical protein [Clostridia bacterium]
MNKYYNDAIIGNKEIVASFTKKGELIRLYYPNRDYRQFIDFLHIGVKINDSSMIYLHDDINNTYKQFYTENTNILNTEILNTYFNLRVLQTDFVCNDKNILIRKYKIKNENNIDLNVNFIAYSSLLTSDNNQVSGYCKNNSLFQYMHDYTFAICSEYKINKSQINNNQANIQSGLVGDKDYVGMSKDSSISYDLGKLKPNEEIEFCIYITIYNGADMKSIDKKIEDLKVLDYKKELENTRKYWEKYVKEHDTIKLINSNTDYMQRIEKIYKRTILLYPLLTNYLTGGISAALEIDENRTKCGRYSYCWPRDAIFITNALDILKMNKQTEKFYKTFCKMTQSKSGMWEQRFYTDGTLAPCWGYQIDETASVIYGVYNHYEHTNDLKFLKDTLKMCENATKYLKKYVQNVLDEKEEEYKSYDLWEENEGIHTYSLAAIFSSFDTMLKVYEIVKPEFKENRLKIEKIEKEMTTLRKYLVQIKEYILQNLYDNNRKTFIRNKDGKMDISILGLVTPFNLFAPKEKKILNTIERMELTLRTYTGGYLRYEGDNYVGGNPWAIANLWMAEYYLLAGNKNKARECFEFVVKSATEHGFLPEQVDNNTMQAKWVIGLGWSHAMFINVLKKLYK